MKDKTKKTLLIVIAILLCLALIGEGIIIFFIARDKKSAKEASESTVSEDKDKDKEDDSVTEKDDKKDEEASLQDVIAYVRKSFIDGEDEYKADETLVPSVPSYTVSDDLSNISNTDMYTWVLQNSDLRDKLIENGFVVYASSASDEFFDVYESNRYSYLPNFITVDSLMHTYHLYFQYLLKNTEKDYLYNELKGVTLSMYDASKEELDALNGTDWENAAKRNCAYFYIAGKLLGEDLELPSSDMQDTVDKEISLINAAEGIEVSPLMGLNEDYSQYKVRGYYEGDELLEMYFKAMMWYGRMSFTSDDEDMNRSALLMNVALNESALSDWEDIYSVTSFFAGASDDCTYYEYMAAIDASYENIGLSNISDVSGDDDSFNKYLSYVSKMEAPRINSIPVSDDEENVIVSYRFMGQRFSVDETIFTNLTYRNVEEASDGSRRTLPSSLDVCAALGSEEALQILKNDTDVTKYSDYEPKLKEMAEEFDNDDESIWDASLYAGWLNTLRPLLEEKGEGYPSYMQSENWTKKDLETFLGSYTELKHDTVLYSKQLIAEMGDGEVDVLDDRGYVDPEPLVYARFANLSSKTKKGLSERNMLSDSASEDLDRLTEMASILLTISEKELKNESLSDDEYEFIRCYGGDLEHFWYECQKGDTESLSYSYQAPCPVVCDIATDPNGEVLEVATGLAESILVVCPVEGELKICSGSVYSFYEFTVPISERMTDSDWKKRLGIEYDEETGYSRDENLTHVSWAEDYRAYFNYEDWE